MLSSRQLCFLKRSVLAFASCFMAGNTFAQQPDTVFTAGLPGNNLLKLQSDGGFVVRGFYDGNVSSGVPAQQGQGSRLLWFPQRVAFRAGYVADDRWDNINLGFGSFAAGYNNTASANYTTAFGFGSTASQLSSFAVGEQNVANGASSVAMGYHANTNARQGSFVFGDRSTVDTIRSGINHSATWRVTGGFRIFTAASLSAGVTIQSGTAVSNWGQSSAVISTSTGAMLSTGGVWVNVSDVNRKHLFGNISGESILERLKRIPIQEWSYKTEPANVRHIGPTAQDFSKAFGLGVNDVTIGTVDADGVALACIQALEKRTEDQAEDLKALQRANMQLKERLEMLEKNAGDRSGGINLAILPFLFFPVACAGMWWYRKRHTTG